MIVILFYVNKKIMAVVFYIHDGHFFTMPITVFRELFTHYYCNNHPIYYRANTF